eukprot:scaffold329507_cov116-Tisochrysis_lutea.AAC.2
MGSTTAAKELASMGSPSAVPVPCASTRASRDLSLDATAYALPSTDPNGDAAARGASSSKVQHASPRA